MATITSTLKLQDKMSSTFSSITKAMHSTLSAMQSVKTENGSMSSAFKKAQTDILNAEKSLKSFEQQTKQADDAMKKGTTSAGSFLKSLLGFGAIQKIFGMITSQLDSAISRMDTLNNFPKVMSNLGIDESQASAAIDTLSEKLQGLPTTLDSAAAAVQRFTSANNNVGASTEMYLALNNAILAGGADMSIQQSALEQLSQAYSKGKPDMMEWRALQQAMPAQLQQIAKAMNMTTAQLGESLRGGKVSMNDFMKTVVRLNKEGVNGFKSFEEQAKNSTGGIRTSLANMRSAITRGVGSIMTSVDKALEKAGFGTLSSNISKFGKAIEKILKTVGNIIGQIISFLSPILSFIRQIGEFVRSNWTVIEPIIQAIVIVLGIYYTYTLLASVGTKILTVAMQALTNPMFWIMVAIIAIVAILIYLWNTSDDVAYYMLYAWDALRLGAMTLQLGVQAAFYAIILAGLYMYEGILGIKLGLQTAFYMIVLGAQTMELGFKGVAEGVVNAVIWMYNKIVEILNKLGAKFDTINYADFTSKTVSSISKTMGDYATATAKTYGEMGDISDKISDYQAKLNDITYNGATNIQNKATEFNATRGERTANRKKLSASSITGGLGSANISALSGDLGDLLNNVTGSDGSGGKAIKTTSKDKLLTDEDIQLLLDIATRDYKLNYQQVTPNITLTFGDVRETANVDDILDEVADRLEEIYDANLEVG